MKIVNIVLSVLILLLAAVSAVFSYFLFEKRSQLVNGWSTLAKTIQTVSAELDKDSGTTYASKLTPKELAYQKSEALSKKLAEFTTQSILIIKERNALGEGMRRVGLTVKMPKENLPSREAFLGLNSYNGNIEAVLDAVRRQQDMRNRTNQYVIDFARSSLGVNITHKQLETANPAAFEAMRKALRVQGEKIRTYENGYRIIAAETGAASPQFNQYDKVSSPLTQRIREQKALYQQLSQKYMAEQRKANELNRQLKAAQAEIAKRDKIIAGIKKDMTDLNFAAGIEDKSVKSPVWADGSQEALRAMRGRVLEVSPEYGYVVVSLGTRSAVKQEIAMKTVEVKLNLKSGMDLAVMRPDKNGRMEFISRITVDQISDYSLTANIPQGGRTIAIGDQVCYIDPVEKETVPAAKGAKK